MHRIIEVKSYHLGLIRLFRDSEYNISKLNILRYFECVTFGFLVRPGASKEPFRRAEVDVLPRIAGNALAFEVNANVENDDEVLGNTLAEGFTRFFAREFAGDGAADEFVRRHGADHVQPLFFTWEANLALRLGFQSSPPADLPA